MHENEDILLDRLVDGELSDTERRELLVSLDDRPEGWRKCALAFLEAQSWRRELGRLATEPAVAPKLGLAAAEDAPLASRRAVQFLTLAAGVFVAFTLGLAFGDLPHPHQRAAPSPSNPPLAATPRVPSTGPGTPSGRVVPMQPGVSGDALTLWARDEAGQMRPLRVPLVDASTMDRRLGTAFPARLTPAQQKQFEERGYRVESKRRYAPLVIDGGRPIVVPVEDTKIVPVGNPVY
jgi:anti-sigma factor RsiW